MVFSQHSTLQQTAPHLPYERIAEAILGKNYELSLVFIGDQRSQTLNRTYRNHDQPASVLSFPLDKEAGEIYINIPYAGRRARRQPATLSQTVAYLFIHGLLHLNGHDHGGTMDKREKEYCAQFGIPYP